MYYYINHRWDIKGYKFFLLKIFLPSATAVKLCPLFPPPFVHVESPPPLFVPKVNANSEYNKKKEFHKTQ